MLEKTKNTRNGRLTVLVTGCDGQLGSELRKLAKSGDCSFCRFLFVDVSVLDICNRADVHNYFKTNHIDVIVNCAAYTAVDRAEDEPESAFAVNRDGVGILAECCVEEGAYMIHISTDYVFDGLLSHDKEYEVTDRPNPVSEYGKTKWEGEEEARKWEKTFIVRISWVFGINGHNFVRTMLKLGKTHSDLNVVNDQIGSPTYTYDLSKLLCDVMETEKYGTYQATNEGYCSWNDFAKAIFKEANMDVTVHEISTEDYLKLSPQQAKRPFNSRMSKKTLDKAGFQRLPTWQDALHRYIETLRKENLI